MDVCFSLHSLIILHVFLVWLAGKNKTVLYFTDCINYDKIQNSIDPQHLVSFDIIGLQYSMVCKVIYI